VWYARWFDGDGAAELVSGGVARHEAGKPAA
jgi:hypothetical protein